MISVTDLSTLNYCSRKLFLSKVLGIKEPAKKTTLLGTMHHEALEIASSYLQRIVGSTSKGMEKQEIFELFYSHYLPIAEDLKDRYLGAIVSFGVLPEEVSSSLKKTLRNEAFFMAARTKRYMESTGLYGDELFLKMPKVISEIRLKSEKMGLTGRIDRAEFGQESIMIYEMKTGKSPISGVWPGHRTQIMAYMLLVKEEFKKDTAAIVYYIDSNESKEIKFNSFMAFEIGKLIENAKSLIRQRKLPEITQNRNKCLSCGLREKCHDQALMGAMMKDIMAQTTLEMV